MSNNDNANEFNFEESELWTSFESMMNAYTMPLRDRHPVTLEKLDEE